MTEVLKRGNEPRVTDVSAEPAAMREATSAMRAGTAASLEAASSGESMSKPGKVT